MYKYLKLIRYKNLLFIAFTQFLIKYGLFEAFGADITLSLFGCSLLALATVSLAAGGYIINDVYDVETDKINRGEDTIIGPHISETTGTTLFIILNVIGVGIGFYLSNIVGWPAFSALWIFASAILYFYATYLKQMTVVGNIIVSCTIAGVVVIVGLYDLLPAINNQNQPTQALLFSILLDYALFAFLINLLREMVKDQEDIKGDYNAGMKTLPIQLGTARTNKVILGVALIPVAAIVYYLYNYLFENTYATIYVLLFILAPLLYVMVKIPEAKKKKQFTQLSIILKLILFFGLISLGLHKFIL
ncbi:geranylgeranylglycerol-phosphate geranylgeranyltransferase [Autumnicola psychrophila]|uniref:Geranylgeranylglycerol-phosphate geranylgeranyltransferase n=1 Tax=Autumnicola psychrophila TaxID=3075592 RepID=A0ABU3DVP9_9FLAO|nr:geranylgeranylglycerol-phosphate geranylgeranyltransferase [Zunongwangia sp. F225]MDT0687787.1 geranylgeranylglycerol-phosphate geranylgeranyltransferase [Zunongwangia sp. F225]